MSAAAPDWRKRTRTWSDTDSTWRTYKLPEGIAVLLEEAITLRMKINDWFGDQQDVKVARLDAIESIVVDALLEDRPYYWQLTAAAIGDDTRRHNTLLALERAGFRCEIPACRKSTVNVGGTEVHHVFPRSHALEYRQLFGGNVHDLANMIVLCSHHHNLVTHPPDSRWKWRNLAPRFFEINGHPDMTATLRNGNLLGNAATSL